MESDSKKTRKPNAEESDLNVRKAVSFASRGRGGVALGRSLSRGGRRRGGAGGGRGGKGRR